MVFLHLIKVNCGNSVTLEYNGILATALPFSYPKPGRIKFIIGILEK